MISQCEIELQKENRDNRTQSGIKAMYIKYQVAVAVAVASVANGVYWIAGKAKGKIPLLAQLFHRVCVYVCVWVLDGCAYGNFLFTLNTAHI